MPENIPNTTELTQQEPPAGIPGAAAQETHEASPIRISLKAEEIFHIGPPTGGFPVTNSLFLSVIVLVFLSGVAAASYKRVRLIPGKLQSLFELFLEAALSLMDTILGERAKSEKYLPLVATIFLFVLFSNWFGLLPGIGSLLIKDGAEYAPLLRSPSADLNFTLGLGIVAVLAINILGAAAIGTWRHASKFFNFKGPIDFFIGLIELVSEFARMISFSFRLFGNVFAGEVLLTIVAFLAPYIIPLPFMFLEVFVGFVQALIFSMLTLVFVAIAIATHGEEHQEPAPARA